MKFLNITLLFVLFTFACLLTTSWAQDEAQSAAKRLVAARRPIGKAGKASTTTAPPPAEEDEGEYPDENQENQYGDEGEEQAVSSTTTSTEPPKKVGPVIRPFRSNDDFLNSLKRRQMNAKHNKHIEKPKSKPTPAAQESEEEEAPAPAPVSAKSYKPNSALSRRKLAKPSKHEAPADDAAAAESEPQKEESKVKRPLSSRLALRKRN